MRMQVFAWGLNSAGQLGMGDSVSRKSPCAIEALWAMPVQQLAAGLACRCVSQVLPEIQFRFQQLAGRPLHIN